ncbi:MAG: HTTM domain-containing protein [Pseudomonadota bacterium]
MTVSTSSEGGPCRLDPWTLSVSLFGVYLVTHAGGFADQGIGAALTFAVLVLGGLVVVFPRYGWLFALAIGVHVIELVEKQPIQSNHMFMAQVLALGIGVALVGRMIAERRVSVDLELWYRSFAPLGRCMLLVMYFWGTLHKVNEDFLEATTSCAIALWTTLGLPDVLAHNARIHEATMWGTLVLETIAILCLLVPRFRQVGILLGIGFHGMLGFSSWGQYIAFSCLSIALHSFFLPAETMQRWRATALGREISGAGGSLIRRVGIALLAVFALLVLPVELLWALFVLGALAFAAAFGAESREPSSGPWLISPNPAMTVLAVAFLLNGALPYLGTKTGQTLTMFSNLQTEGGETNHYLLPVVPVFDQQLRLAEIVEANAAAFEDWRDGGYVLVEDHLLDFLDRYPWVEITYRVGDEVIHHSAETPAPRLAELPPRWVRDYMVFKPAVVGRPRACDGY